MATPLSPPSDSIREIEWHPQSAVAVTESPFSLKQQVHKFTGQRRAVTVRLAPLSVAKAKQWIAFFLGLNGPEGTFYLSDTIGQNTAILRGGPKVNGAGQTGSSLVTDGWTNSINVLDAGEWISIDEKLYQVTSDVTADGSGNATLSLWPDITRAPADDAVIEADSPYGIFRLVEMPSVRWTVNRLVEGVSFTAVETRPAKILDSLGITADIASSMTRDLYAGWGGSRYDGTVTQLNDQSGNARHWVSNGTADPTLHANGSAVFGTGTSVFDSQAAGSDLGDGRSVFMVIDMDTVNGQILLTRDTSADDLIGAVESGQATSPHGGITVGGYSIDGTDLSPETRGQLYTELTGTGLCVVCIEGINFSEMAGALHFGIDNATWRFEGELHEIIVCPDLSTSAREALIADMQSAYGI